MTLTGALSRRRFLTAGAGLLMTPAIGRAQGLKGRRLTFLIGNEGSGGYEAYARLFAKYLAISLPDARLVVEVVPTADGRLAAKRIAEAAQGDLTIGLFEGALLNSEIEKDDPSTTSLAAFKWLGKMAVDERILIASTQSGIKSIVAMSNRSEPAIFPASSIASRSASECFLLNAILGLQIKPVPGYDGAQRSLAFLSGEGQVILGSYPSQSKFIDRGDAVVLLRLNTVKNPSVPAPVPLLKDIAASNFGDIVDMLELSSNLGRWIASPPSIADADLEVLRASFNDVVASPAFLAEARTLRLTIEPMSGAEVQEKISTLLSRKQALRGSVVAALACGRRRADGDRSC